MRLGSRAYVYLRLLVYLYLRQDTYHRKQSTPLNDMNTEASLNKTTGYEPGTAHLKLEILLFAPKFFPVK
jgi:hypothetical protein